MPEISDQLKKNYPWLTKDFFEKILCSENSNKRICIKNYEVKAALAHGENYTSQMLRANVTYECDGKKCEKRFIVKAALANKELKAMLDELRLFEKEIIVYKQVLPEVEKLLNSIGDNTKLSAKCYAANLDQSYLVFEDLSVRGYKNQDRRKGLDISHYKKVLTKIAKFHAATAVLHTKNFSPLKEFLEPNVREDSIPWQKVFYNGIETLAHHTAKIPGQEYLSAKLEKLINTMFSKACVGAKRNDAEFNALLHGDLWANNIMFIYDNDGLPSDAIMVDYQIGYWGPVGLDLTYNLFTSSHEDIKECDWDKLIQYYHQQLKSTLIALNYSKPIPTLTEIHGQFLQRGVTYALFGILLVGVRRLENVEEDGMSKFVNSTEADKKFRMDMFGNPAIANNLKFLLSYFDRKGYLD